MQSFQLAHTVGMLAGLLLSPLWILRRRRARRHLVVHSLPKHAAPVPKYTGAQALGIAGILVFLLPTFLTLSLYLAEGALALFGFLLRVVPLPQPIEIALWALYSAAASFMCFCLTYYLCELTWPDKRVQATRRYSADR